MKSVYMLFPTISELPMYTEENLRIVFTELLIWQGCIKPNLANTSKVVNMYLGMFPYLSIFQKQVRVSRITKKKKKKPPHCSPSRL